MSRTSFAGALAAIAIGAVLAFAVHASPKDLDLQEAGLIIMIGGAVDLLTRSAIADNPLLSRQAADVAAVVEPVGEPVLDAAGNPVFVPNTDNRADQPRPPLVAPLPGTLPDIPRRMVVDPSSWAQEVAIPEPAAYPAQPPDYEHPSPANRLVVAETEYVLDTPEAPQAVRTITGRPVRPRGRWAGRRRP
jgi:hypothetical protein